MGLGVQLLGTLFELIFQHITAILVFLTTFLVARYILLTTLLRPNLPPGPRPWPLIGNILQVGKHPHKALAKLASQYNGLMTVYLGPMRAVVINDLQIVKEAFVHFGDDFSDRKQLPLLEEAWGTKGSILWENGEAWISHRKMIHNAFRSLGFRHKQFHSAIVSEIHALCKHLETEDLIDMRLPLNYTTANVICTLCFEQRFDFKDDKFTKAVNAMLFISKTMSGVSLAHIIPKLYHTPLYSKLRTKINILNTFLQDNVQRHRATFDPNNIRDIVDVYLSSETPEQEDDLIWRGIFDLFTAGTETTADSMLWAILYMVNYPEIQKKVQDELDSSRGDDILQYPENMRRFPFTYATLMEVLRHQSVAPLSVPRMAARNTALCGHFIPKGTSIWVNEWAIHNDPTFWRDPEVFNPSRFLDVDGQHLLRDKTRHLILFGYGKRQCIGKRLAEMEVYMMFCGLLQRFTFSAPHVAKLSTDGHFGLTYAPMPFKVKVQRR